MKRINRYTGYRSGIRINKTLCVFILFLLILSSYSCKTKSDSEVVSNLSAADILGNPRFRAISYGGYRHRTRDIQPSVEELKEDMLILNAMGIRLIRTYNVTKPHASNVLKAIQELKNQDSNFEMYVMLGAWIDCLNAWTELPLDHNQESPENEEEIARAVALANAHPDIVKIVAVGNEAMVKWAASYYVEPWVILKWVSHLQNLKLQGELPSDLWITSSDNFASWGGGSDEYHVENLNKLIKAVDFISMHTYPMHDTHYNPEFWGVRATEESLTKENKIKNAMQRALAYAKNQYRSVRAYVDSIDKGKPIHIGETGWASLSNGFYGSEGSAACDEYKMGLYHSDIRSWTDGDSISCFYFEAFDEPWKDAGNTNGSENHFGLFTVDGKAKYAIWDMVDDGVFEGLARGGSRITKTFDGNEKLLIESVSSPVSQLEVANENF